MKLRRVISLTAGVLLAAMAITALAQGGDKYKIRLTPVPALGSRGAPLTVPNVTSASVAGAIGNASATLNGKKLAVTGSFEMLASPATEAHLFIGPAMGARNYPGVPLFHLMVMKAADGKSGMLSGSFDLSNDQVDALKKGKFYLQVHSEGSPTGHLVGWLVKDAGK
jgi:hypothetical protein